MIQLLNNPIDRFLNGITMYRLVLYYLLVMLTGDFILGLAGLSSHDPAQLTFSVTIVCALSWISNELLARLFRVPANTESVWITALIVVLIMSPVASTDWAGIAGLILTAVAGVASKFILAVNGKHIFNPVALGVVLSAYTLNEPATWWASSSIWLFPVVLMGGFLVLRKMQRFSMFAIYAAVQLIIIVATSDPMQYIELLQDAVLSSPLLFCGFVMLTEPMTAPSGKRASLVYGALVGALAAPPIHVGNFYFSPELALLAGNMFAWIIGPKHRYRLTLERIERVAEGCYDYVFKSNRPVDHKAGQYLDWTMRVPNSDDRGNRRTFTIASSPGEKSLRLGVKFYPGPSAFKKAMLDMRPGQIVFGAQLAGEFVLPETDEKLAFIAGGIGVTPFRSMIQHMVEQGDPRPVTLFYGNNKASEISYTNIFDHAKQLIDLKTVYAVADQSARRGPYHQGFIDISLIKREMPDYRERLFYLSGPRKMVLNFQRILAELGIPRHRIKTDFFPGFA